MRIIVLAVFVAACLTATISAARINTFREAPTRGGYIEPVGNHHREGEATEEVTEEDTEEDTEENTSEGTDEDTEDEPEEQCDPDDQDCEVEDSEDCDPENEECQGGDSDDEECPEDDCEEQESEECDPENEDCGEDEPEECPDDDCGEEPEEENCEEDSPEDEDECEDQETKPEPVCTPFEPLKVGCNTCNCNEHGQFCCCTKMTCEETTPCCDGDTKTHKCNDCKCVKGLWHCTMRKC